MQDLLEEKENNIRLYRCKQRHLTKSKALMEEVPKTESETSPIMASTALLNQKLNALRGQGILKLSEIILLGKSKQKIAARFNSKR